MGADVSEVKKHWKVRLLPDVTLAWISCSYLHTAIQGFRSLRLSSCLLLLTIISADKIRLIQIWARHRGRIPDKRRNTITWLPTATNVSLSFDRWSCNYVHASKADWQEILRNYRISEFILNLLIILWLRLRILPVVPQAPSPACHSCLRLIISARHCTNSNWLSVWDCRQLTPLLCWLSSSV